MTTPGPRTERPRTTLRLTARGWLLLVLAPVLWLAGDVLGLAVPRILAAAALLALALGLVAMLLARIGLDADRQVLTDPVEVGERARIRLDVPAGALALRLPLGRGVLRSELPAALGGPGDLPLLPAAPHAPPVLRRGHHRLGPLRIVLRDVLGLLHLERTLHDDAELTGVPALQSVGALAARAAGISGEDRSATAASVGEISPLARPYVPGDDVRRIHWRASARTGRLMTREEEAAEGSTAVLVLDTRPSPLDDEDRDLVEDRLVAHASSLLEVLAAHGWEVQVLDATGDRIATTPRHGQGHGVLVGEADAIARREARRALAVIGFGDHDDSARPTDHTTGDAGLVIALGAAAPSPFDGLDLDRFAGRSRRRLALALDPDVAPVIEQDTGLRRDLRDESGRSAPAGEHGTTGADAVPGAAEAPGVSRHGRWIHVRGTTAHRLEDLLRASGEAR